MTATPFVERTELHKKEMLYFMDLLIFIIIAAPHTDSTAQKFLEEHLDWWNGHVFERRRVWEYLTFVFGDRHHVLKLGKTALFLQQYRKAIDMESDETTYLIPSDVDDELLNLSFTLLPSIVGVCLEKLAAEFANHPLSHFDELLLVR